MSLRIENQTCYIDTDTLHQRLPASALTVITDSAKSMSAVELAGERIYVTEAEADALTVAGATDGRRHLKATDGDSVI
ncbi:MULTISPECIES: DUF3203 family protein [Pseudomonas]|uniref:DUF3203 family protein n=1 Tax=Pseudomonas TaxID=286 RepID=UPI0020976958|nr:MULTISPECIES: DUF3203 family protein [Pseudomonas]MBW8355690.1 DUF3203 family protein [Pseudomonas sp.]MCO7579696.1 DUF3203 family protein [Pseudomonas protegens]MCO7585478.1 DUF3203 family protein [Pseudomonas chlororaphis]MCO7602654.1 DUF3203 family protein [Pseudomonas chlororaphis]MDC7815254.1 DUF3203 family protein [Pseudomonas sp. BLCC-B112]